MALIKCPDCGKEYSSFTSACPSCGCPNDGYTQQSNHTEKVCPDCGKPLDPSAKSCPHCGCPIEEKVHSNGSNSSKDRCPDCGAVVESTMKSCPKCGCVLKKEEANTKFVIASLLPNEKILCTAKWHWINYIIPAIFFVLGIEFMVEGDYVSMDDFWYYFIGFLIIAIGILFIFEIRKYEFVVTNKRIFIKQGVILRASYELRLEKLESIQVYQGILGRLFNFGIILVHGVGASRGMAGMLVAPLEFRQHIFAELSKQNNTEEE